MLEKSIRGLIVTALKSLDAQSVENVLVPGMPDVAYIGGWLELKQVAKWPLLGRPLQLHHFTPQQRAWLFKHRRLGGQAHVLLLVGRDWILLDGSWASQHLGQATQSEILENAECHWHPRLNQAELLHFLQSKR